MAEFTINVVVTTGGTIDADLSGVQAVNVEVVQGGQIAAEITGGGRGPQGEQGEQGIQGETGATGATGAGVNDGGTTGQVLRKASNADQDTEWHTPVKADVGLSNVDNTSDANKPVSTAQATAIGVVQTDIDNHEANTSNPHSVTKSQVGLGNVDNVQQQPLDSDLTAIAGLSPSNDDIIQRKAGAWTNRTVAQYLTDLGLAAIYQPLDADLTAIAGLDSSTSGAIASDGAGWIKKTYAQFKTALGLVKGDVGLGNVDNTSDANKPISTATQTALDLKEDISALGDLAYEDVVDESLISLSDNTTNNFSTTKHGFVPKGTNVGSFLKDDGTWAAIPGGGDALTSNPLSQFAATTSLQLKGVMSDETGSGALVFGTSPNITTPTGIVKGDVGLGNVDNTSDATKQAATLLAAFPVGSIYINTSNTNPGTFLGGTWAAFGAGRVPVGFDSGQTEFDTDEETGGSKTQASNVTVATQPTFTVDSHTHTGPSHTHGVADAYGYLTNPTGRMAFMRKTIPQWTQTHEVTGTAGTASATSTTGLVLGGATEAGGTGNTGTASVNTTTRSNDVALTNNAVNNLQPYIVVRMWKRTA